MKVIPAPPGWWSVYDDEGETRALRVIAWSWGDGGEAPDGWWGWDVTPGEGVMNMPPERVATFAGYVYDPFARTAEEVLNGGAVDEAIEAFRKAYPKNGD